MRFDFAKNVLQSLGKQYTSLCSESWLAVCAGSAEQDLFVSCGFKNVTLTSLDPSIVKTTQKPFLSSIADVRRLPFEDKSYDWVFVSDGLHHCDSPHAALVEMYRVSKRGVIIIESRDSFCMRLAVRGGFADTYERGAVAANNGLCGGVNFTNIPNFVYRWTEKEFRKTISCADPTGVPTFHFHYGFNPPVCRHTGLGRLFYKAFISLAHFVLKLFPKQSNSFAMVALRPKQLHPWLEAVPHVGIRFITNTHC